jgi:hypothetical protein
VDVLWADAELESLAVDYDDARVILRESTGRVVTVVGVGLIGVEFLGLWDELIVERGKVVAGDAFSRECYQRVLDRLGPHVRDSGSPVRNRRRFSTLTVTFIDGSALRIAAADFAATSAAPS